jgi:2'-5' RNA ligase
MRVFVAVFPPPEVREALHRAALDLPASGGFRLTDPWKIHLTLKFLGDVADEDLGRIREALERARDGHEPFEVATSGFGVFPSEKKARILWAGIGEGSQRLRGLAGGVEGALEEAGFGREARPYVPHLTLGRARGRPVQFAIEGSAPALRFTVSGLDLVRSAPGASGVTYSVLAAYPFRDAGS